MIAQKAQHTPKKRVRVLREGLYSTAKEDPGRSFGVLYDKVCSKEVMEEAWRLVAGKKGKAGVDGKSIDWIREYGVGRYLEELREALVVREYRPDKIRRAYIPKGDGRRRPLGIPTVTDRVVQAAVKLVIEPLYEADFCPNSYGFRPGRSSHDAIGQIDSYLRQGYRWVIDVDLRSYFDTIPHAELLEKVGRRVRDPEVLRLIRWWLKAGVLEKGEVSYPELGSPQGGVISPLLSNIYLHDIDEEWQGRGPEAILVRYADDMVILCRTKRKAQQEHAHLQERLRAMQLELNAEKTRITPARNGFDFLGFSYRRGVFYRDGKRREIVVKVPGAKARKGIRQKIKEAVKSTPLGEPVWVAAAAVNRRLRGWANYFRIGNARRALNALVWYAEEQLRLFLRRKHHRKGLRSYKKYPSDYLHRILHLYTVKQLLRARS